MGHMKAVDHRSVFSGHITQNNRRHWVGPWRLQKISMEMSPIGTWKQMQLLPRNPQYENHKQFHTERDAVISHYAENLFLNTTQFCFLQSAYYNTNKNIWKKYLRLCRLKKTSQPPQWCEFNFDGFSLKALPVVWGKVFRTTFLLLTD